jgi:hypothetical protein
MHVPIVNDAVFPVVTYPCEINALGCLAARQSRSMSRQGGGYTGRDRMVVQAFAAPAAGRR